MKILILGAAAGGGFPQWNANDGNARRVRAGQLPPATQSAIAVSADGEHWTLINASPDLRQQINDNPALHPKPDDGVRASPVAAVVLTNADVDHVAGLLTLREGHPLAIHAHPRVLDVLAANSIFQVLDPDLVARRPLAMDIWHTIRDRAGAPLGLRLRPFAVPGKIALWLEDGAAPGLGTQEGDTIGLEIADEKDGASFFYIPGCAAMTPDLARRLAGARLVLFDGTLWRDDEMIVAGAGAKTGRRMGHISCTGADGSIAAFADLNVARKLFIHINNTNPLLDPQSPERREAKAAGWEVAHDGMEIDLECTDAHDRHRALAAGGV